MAEDWTKYNKEIRLAIKEDGARALIRSKVLGDYNITTGKKTPTAKDNPVYIMFAKKENINEQLNRDEMLVLCSTVSEFFSIQNGKNLFLVYEDKEYEIIESRPVMPGGTVLFYKLICRR